MISISDAFESGLKIDINHDYGIVRFLIDPTSVLVRKYPLITHQGTSSTLWTNSLEVLPSEGFSGKLIEPYHSYDIEFAAVQDEIFSLTLANTTVPYNSYFTYKPEQGFFMICKESTIGYTKLKEFAISTTGNKEEYIDQFTGEHLDDTDATATYLIGYREAEEDEWVIIAKQVITIDFEDILLSGVDEEDSSKMLTLRIRYNPQISSFKTNIQEEKIDTIGSQFPFFVRNGTIGYKEIPLGGLLSYHMDELHMFLPDHVKNKYFPTELQRAATNSQVSFENIGPSEEFYIERIFKNRVEKWLNNGLPKIIRTPAEGNFLVRLMGVSLTPMDQLARRLHSFTATAYEIAPYANLENYFTMFSTQPQMLVKTDSSIDNPETVTYSITNLPITLTAAEGQYIVANAVAQLEIDHLNFSGLGISYHYNKQLHSNINGSRQEEVPSPPKTLNFGRISPNPINVAIRLSKKVLYLKEEEANAE